MRLVVRLLFRITRAYVCRCVQVGPSVRYFDNKLRKTSKENTTRHWRHMVRGVMFLSIKHADPLLCRSGAWIYCGGKTYIDTCEDIRTTKKKDI